MSSGSAGRTRWLLALSACVAAFLADAPARADDAPIVAEIKAVDLTKFAPFVDWPGRAAKPVRAQLCVEGDDRIAGMVQMAESTIAAEAGAMEVRPLSLGSKADGCAVLFVGVTDPVVLKPVLAAVARAPVLTVTELEGAGARGIINFVIRDDRVRFQIDAAEAHRHGLRINASLLSLAVAVEP